MEATKILAQVRDLYDRGQYVAAYETGRQAWGAPSSWPGTDARILAVRVAANCGAPRLADWLVRLAYREAPDHSEARYYEGRRVGRRRGPYEGLRWMRRHGDLPASASADIRASWYTLGAEHASMLRDFDEAELWMHLAEKTDPDNPWVKVSWAAVREREDRYDEAVATLRTALEMRPWYRPAVQSLAHLLSVGSQEDEAIELLQQAAERLQCYSIHAQLLSLYLERKQYDQALAALNEVERLVVLGEKPLPQWFAANRSEIMYFLGDIPASIQFARQSDSKYWKAIADRLEDPAYAAAQVRLLDVGFVRQHHATCAPATLSALSRFWGMPADHLQVADEICYNGTSSFSERKWATDHGWVAREFSVTEESAQALIDRGIPFTFTTVDPGNSHLQAIIGYDGRRGTLVIRDPYWRSLGEGLAKQLLERYQASGPRGMAMAPIGRSSELDSLELPDAPLWDRLHAFDHALVEHRREEAMQAYEQLRQAAAEHRLTYEARRRLAIYDGNATEHLAAVEWLVQAYPNDQRLEYERLALLRNQGRRDERLATYERLCVKSETHPIFWQQYANELRVDARRWDEAIVLLRRAIRRWPSEASNYATLAHLYWDQRRFADALDLHRFATCLGDKDEQFVMSYFAAADWFKQTDEALRLLRNRFERFGKKSSDPARSLVAAYLQLDRYGEALQTIEEALTLRPDDGELQLYAADVLTSASAENLPRARELVEAAKNNAPRSSWLRSAARLAASEDRSADALSLWREALALSPLAMDAHTAVARLLYSLEGDQAAQQHLREACTRFPNHIPLHELWVEWIRDEPPEVREPIIRRLIDVSGDNAWARRELAFLLASQQRDEEAWAESEIAGRLEPTAPSQFLLHARLLRNRGDHAAAKVELRRAIEASVDNDSALAAWLDLCETIAERRAVIDFFQSQLQTQVTFGDGLLALRERASDTLEADELLGRLREALAHRPDLWHAWSALVLQLLDANELDEAWTVACQATDRFPLLPRLWLDRADVCRARLDWTREREALENAHRINPSWSVTVRRLCESFNQQGEYDRSLALLTAAVTRQPNDATTRTLLAETRWRIGDKQAAVEAVREAVKVDPGLSRGWDLLQRWTDALQTPEVPRQTARALTESHPGDARGWLALARMLDQRSEVDERLAAYDRAIELGPRNADAYDQKAETLAFVGRYDEAVATCRPPVFGAHPPTSLRGREAWIESERGELKTAIERMRAVLEEEPFYYWGWSRMADWSQAVDDMPGYLQAAQWMVRLSPQYEVSIGYLGEALQLNGDRDGAREAYARAFELNPRYEFAGTQLFDLLLEDGALEEAGAALERLLMFNPGPLTSARGAKLAAKRGDQATALEHLAYVATQPHANSWPVETAFEACEEAGWKSEAAGRLQQLVLDDAPVAAAAEKWVELLVESAGAGALNGAPGGALNGAATTRVADEIARLARRAATLPTVDEATLSIEESAARERVIEAPRSALRAYLHNLIERKAVEELRRVVQRHDAWLRSDPQCWGLVGWAFTSLRKYGDAAEWMRDWQQRTDSFPWAMVNAAEGFRNTDRESIGAACNQFALTLPPSNGIHLHHLWLASDAIAARDVQTTEQRLEQAEEAARGERLDADYGFLRFLIDALVSMEKSPPGRGAALFQTLAGPLTQARMEYAPFAEEPARQRLFRLALRRLAKLGGLKGWCWYAYWRIRSRP
ncbi:MAG: C39 family peptidase [Pirellulales bacterium]